jgi:hypothetical protein
MPSLVERVMPLHHKLSLRRFAENGILGNFNTVSLFPETESSLGQLETAANNDFAGTRSFDNISHGSLAGMTQLAFRPWECQPDLPRRSASAFVFSGTR